MLTEPGCEATVAVIDDEETIREGCRRTLTEKGYRTAVAEDGPRGLRLVEQTRPNVVLVDLKMPGMGGMEVLAKIRQIDPRIVMIIITGYGTIDSAVAAMRAGAYDYLCKPFAPNRLLEVVARGLEGCGLEGRAAVEEREATASGAPGRAAGSTRPVPTEGARRAAVLPGADVIVVGGSAAGVTAAITAKRHHPDKSVLLIRKEEQVLIPCGIPYIFGTVGSPQKDLIPDTVLEKNDIRLLVDEVVGIDRASRRITTADGQTLAYEKLVLAVGSDPAVPPIPGVDMDNIFVVEKDVRYLQRMLKQLEGSSDVVIIGGGFIGVEFADECRKNRQVNITLVEMLPHCLMLSFDEDICAAAETVARQHGIQILAPEKVEAFVGNGAVTGVRLASGRELKADMVIVGIGCRANRHLAEKMGLELGQTGAIQVNRYMQTSDENIFACGDCAEKTSFFDGKPSAMKLASTAAREARIAGANLFAKRRINEGQLGVWSTVLADSAFAGAGLSQSQAKQKGYDVIVGEAEAPNRHPGGMAGAANLKVRLIFERGTGVLLGGQVTGARSGGELVNLISACIRQRMTVDNVATFPMGTHPALTASPIAYQLANAAEMAISAMKVTG